MRTHVNFQITGRCTLAIAYKADQVMVDRAGDMLQQMLCNMLFATEFLAANITLQIVLGSATGLTYEIVLSLWQNVLFFVHNDMRYH